MSKLLWAWDRGREAAGISGFKQVRMKGTIGADYQWPIVNKRC